VPYPLSPYLSRTPFHRQNPSNLWSSVNQLNRSVSLDIYRFSICFHQLTVWSTGFSGICYIYLCIPVHRWWFFIKVWYQRFKFDLLWFVPFLSLIHAKRLFFCFFATFHVIEIMLILGMVTLLSLFRKRNSHCNVLIWFVWSSKCPKWSLIWIYYQTNGAFTLWQLKSDTGLDEK
jgi:hypothetical protein